MNATKSMLPNWMTRGGSHRGRLVLYPTGLIACGVLAWLGFVHEPEASTDTLKSSAMVLAQTGAVDAAEANADIILSRDADDVDGRLLKGFAHEHRKDYDAAIAVYVDTLPLVEDDDVRADINLSIADLHRRAGRNAEASGHLDLFERREGKHPGIHRLRGILARESGDAGAARMHFDRWLAMEPEDVEAQTLRTACLLDLGDLSQAEAGLEALDAKERMAWPLWQVLAKSRLEAGDETGASAALAKLKERDQSALQKMREDEFWRSRLEADPFRALWN